jgi:hypothetical protein
MDWNVLASLSTLAAAIFAGWAAFEAKRAAETSERFQREQSIDHQWMIYQEYYGRCIDLYKNHPGMPPEAYLELPGDDKRRLHLAAVALLQTLDLAYRANDVERAGTIKEMLCDHRGPLITDGAIRIGAIADQRTLDDWNALRQLHARKALSRTT